MCDQLSAARLDKDLAENNMEHEQAVSEALRDELAEARRLIQQLRDEARSLQAATNSSSVSIPTLTAIQQTLSAAQTPLFSLLQAQHTSTASAAPVAAPLPPSISFADLEKLKNLGLAFGK